MTEKMNALVKADPKVKDQIAALVRAGTPPPGLPVAVEDWGASDSEDRQAMVVFYLSEMATTTDGIKPEFPRVKIPSGGLTVFAMADGSVLKELVGIVIFHAPARAWWKSNITTGTPPDCSSNDGIVPVDDSKSPGNTKTCTTCPKNKFGSATAKDGGPGRGKACKEIMRTWWWDGESLIPYYLPLPVMSIKPFNSFVSGLINAKKPLTAIRVTGTLEARKNAGGDPYAVLAVAVHPKPVTFPEMQKAVAMRERFQEEMRRRSVTDDEVDAAGDERDAEPEVLGRDGRPIGREPGDDPVDDYRAPARTDSERPKF